MELSSSSDDDELEQQLLQNMKRLRTEENNIFSMQRAPEEKVVVTPNGQLVRFRKGTIFVPVRDQYIHILDAKCRPEHFFGDPNLRPSCRKPLLPQVVQLLEVSDCGVYGSCLVTLADAKVTNFYIFKRLIDKKYNEKQESKPTVLLSTSVLAEPYYQRIIDYPRWKRSCLYPIRMRVGATNLWKTDLHQLEHVCADGYGRVWWCDATGSRFGTFLSNSDYFVVAEKHFSPQQFMQKAIGIGYVQSICRKCPDEDALLLIGEKYLTLWSLHDEYSVGMPSALGRSQTGEYFNDHPFKCCYLPAGAADFIWLALATECIVMEARFDCEIGKWQAHKLRGFSSRCSVSALCAVHYSCANIPYFVVNGLRNGSIYITPLQGKNTSFESFNRHHRAGIAFLHPIPHCEHRFLSVSANAEVKIWDLRYFSPKQPVCCPFQGTRFDTLNSVKASVSGSLLAVASNTLGVYCLDVNNGNKLFELSADVSIYSTICLHQTEMDYELLIFGPSSTQRYVFENIT